MKTGEITYSGSGKIKPEYSVFVKNHGYYLPGKDFSMMDAIRRAKDVGFDSNVFWKDILVATFSVYDGVKFTTCYNYDNKW